MPVKASNNTKGLRPLSIFRFSSRHYLLSHYLYNSYFRQTHPNTQQFHKTLIPFWKIFPDFFRYFVPIMKEDGGAGFLERKGEGNKAD